MNWRFWEPRHTVESVAARLANGLAEGSIILASRNEDGVVFEFDVPGGTPDDQLLSMLKKLVAAADQDHRANGGQGLQLATIEFKQHHPTKQATVALATTKLDDDTKSLDAVIRHFRDKPPQIVENLVVEVRTMHRPHSVVATPG